MPVVKYGERRASVCAGLYISIVTTETSYISVDDCFAAFCQSGLAFAAPKEHQYYNTKPPWANTTVSLGSVRVGKGKMRE